MRKLGAINIFDIECKQDLVFDAKLVRYGTLDVRTSDHSESLDLYVKWDGQSHYEIINQYKPEFYFIKD